MKTIFSLLTCLIFAASAYSQSIRVTFNGNRDYQLKVDGKTYNSSGYLNNDLVLNSFTGNHTINIYRTNKKGKNKLVYSSDVVVSPSEEIHLTVNQNGTIQREESSSSAAYGYSAMTDAAFNDVYWRVYGQWGESAKMSTARDIFNSSSYHFSTDQAKRIIGLLNLEPDRLELAKLAYNNITDPANFNQVYDLLNDQSSRNELDNYIHNSGLNPYNSEYRAAMTNSSFGQLYRNISSEWSTSARLSAATDAFNSPSNYFTVAQASQIISLFNTENDRLQLAKLSVNKIIDRGNINHLDDLLSTQWAKSELDDYIRNNGYSDNNYGYNNYHTAMTDDEFTNVYDNIRKKWLPFGKYNAAVEAFNSSDNYFTTAQVKQIISLLSDESNRLELAKLAYDNVVDKQNYRALYDLFDRQQNRDELDDFIQTNNNY